MSSNRDSLHSASSGYPSSLSSLSMSALGLTDSPLPQRHRKSPSVGSSPSSSPTRQKPARATPSKASLRQEATTNAAVKVVHQQRSADSVSHQRRTSQSGTKENQPAKAVGATKNTPTKAATRASAPQAARTSAPQVAQPDQRVTSRSSKTPKEAPLADDWEEQLARDANKLSLGTTPQARAREEPHQLSEGDTEWERLGQAMSDSRKKEDQSRREIPRAIALPPSTPRTPIRAVVNGVTSIHVGVRPRLHPSREYESMTLNQPDLYSPAPFCSPNAANSDLQTSSPHVARHGVELLQKAQKEYEEWKARKEEREGGMETGSRDWEPKTREIAGPSALSSYNTPMFSPGEEAYNFEQYHPSTPAPPIQPSSQPLQKGKSSSSRPSPTTKATQRQDMPSPRPDDMEDVTQAQGMAADQYMQQYPGANDPYAYPYWDPSYWWAMYGGMDPMGMGAQNMQSGHYSGGFNGQAGGNPELGEQQAYDLSSMMYNPYQWGGGMGGGMMGHGQNGYPGGQSMYGQQSMMDGNRSMGMGSPSVMGSGQAQAGGGGDLKAFDPTKMKQGRQGHYGYLEGRELAGPPPGYAPAGIAPASSPGTATATSHRGGSTVGPPSSAGHGAGSSWGDSSNNPRARYDGAAHGIGYVQADLDSPYPRAPSGLGTNAYSRYGADGSVMNGDARVSHRRIREGRV
ncbi:hypothetical protein L202_05016 [Cryptococcus amylolentus CBS 6039]|uniref:Uncharacterized protein n=1 Tax=Cryptococcus amylolentus CBS 6039 TaxID=1295533 RepID=A0A1E3HNI5_9TREE|nr:hypothetical protein L202_05016 [Cryptococcus amylolentus CBS 6039]ODN77910.1 hypothetical protein L202_05016 [Cryptococcus amylolentus CBS 6039]